MPPPPRTPKPIEVLITGFGPFGPFASNPSWESVGPLHDVELDLSTPPSQSTPTSSSSSSSRKLHIQTLQSSVCYSNILSLVPRLHDVDAAPASPSASPWVDPRGATDGAQGTGEVYPTGYRVSHPSAGYDLIVHVGVGRKGSINLESQAHKDAYRKPDVRNHLAPLRGGDLSGEMTKAAEEESRRWDEACRKAGKVYEDKDEKKRDRGYAEGYEGFDMVEKSRVDVQRLQAWLKGERGLENVAVSTDPGRYLCDFIYYCTLAESKRAAAASKSRTEAIPTLFIHVPPDGEPYTPEQTRVVIRDAVWWIVNEVYGKEKE